jgi:hypothetical protein
LSVKQAKEKASNYYILKQGLVYAFMTMAYNGKDPTPMQWLYRSRLSGFKIQCTTTTTAKGKI